MFKNFQQFISEANDHILDKVDIASYDKAQEQLKTKVENFCQLVESSSFLNSQLLWRGFKTKGLTLLDSCLMRVKPRSNFRGLGESLTSTVKRMILQLQLEDKPLIFTVHNQDYASFFGIPYVVVPENPFVSVMSEEVRDLKNLDSTLNKQENGNKKEEAITNTEKQIIDSAKTYKFYNNQIPYHTNNEVIISTDSYYLISPKYINKLNLIKTKLPEEITIYKELVDSLKKSFDL